MLTDVVIANKSYTKLKITERSVLDSIALNVLRHDCPDFLMPVKMMEIDGEIEIRYELLEGVRLSYLPKEMNKKDFILMLVNMLVPFKICNDWFLDHHNFVLDENYILVGKNGQSIKYIYVPTVQWVNNNDAIKEFFTNIILKTDIKDDLGYMVNLLRIIKNPDANLITLLEYLQKPETEPNPPMEQDLSAEFQEEEKGSFEHFEKEVIPSKEKVFGENDEENRLIENLYGEFSEPVKNKNNKKRKDKPQKNGGLFGSLFKGKGKEKKAVESLSERSKEFSFDVRNDNQERVTILQYVEDQTGIQDDKTAIKNDNKVVGNSVLRLQLESCTGCSCPQFIEIDLQKGFATVGRKNKNGENQSDFNFDASVSFVSRRHFRIEKRGEQWQIIDLESTNGTFVNGENLYPNIPHLLSRNDTIMIFCNKRRLIYRVY